MTSSEFAVVMPVVIVIVMLTVQLGLLFHARQISGAAAAEAIDAAQTPTGTTQNGERAAHAFLAQSGNLINPVVDVTRTAEVVTVRVSGGAPRLVPGFAWRVSTVAQAPVERFVPEPQR